MAKKKAVAPAAPEKFSASKTLETGLIFDSLDPTMAKLRMENVEGLLSNRAVQVSPFGLFPEDFTPADFEVTGKVTIEIEVKAK